MRKEIGHPSVNTFVWWCGLMEINPSHIESILEYRRISKKLGGVSCLK